MLIIYFSGTGNSEYIAKQFSKKMNAECHSIEENISFKELFQLTDTVAVVYPIYGSCVPRIMREFVKVYLDEFKNKKLIIFCTQMLFSGDGARAFARLIPDSDKHVIYAEHFKMPNNICNSFLPMTKKELIAKPLKANKKLDKVCADIKKGVIKRRGWNVVSMLLGKTQNIAYPTMEEKARHDFKADHTCILCGLCVKACPMHNLEIADGVLNQKDNCTVCYRCVNICPKQAATVYFKSKPRKQYKGLNICKEDKKI